MKLRHFLIAAVPLALCACGISPAGNKVTGVSAAEASASLAAEKKPVLLDVRTEEEFASGHLPGAKLMPWTDSDFTARAKAELDRSEPVLVYCRSGKRSAAAAKKLSSLGFADVRNLDGGILAWKNDGRPVTKPR